MESFGLFNFLKSAFSPPSASESDKDSSEGSGSFFNPAALFKNFVSSAGAKEKEKETENKAETDFPARENAANAKGNAREPVRGAAEPADATGENNPFLALMERHERLAKNIDRKTPRR